MIHASSHSYHFDTNTPQQGEWPAPPFNHSVVAGMDLSNDHDHAVKARLVRQFADYISGGIGSGSGGGISGVLGASAAAPGAGFFGAQ